MSGDHRDGGHGGHHAHAHAGAQDAAFWDRMWSGRPASRREPNAFLVESVEGVAPSAALDVACGEGSDALWLAERGWSVTAVDISTVALARGRAADTNGHVTWIHVDIATWEPPVDAFDLVSAHFLHVPPAERPPLFARLARAVRIGGMFVFEAHHPSDLETTLGRPALADRYFTAEDVEAMLGPGRWESLVRGTRPRTVRDREGREITIRDAVLKARRLG